MALVVEDGTGLSTAESYISVADADAYLAKFGNPSAWTALSTGDKEVALREATRYMDGRYSWIGCRSQEAQALDWPRTGARDHEGWAIDYNVVRQEVIDACAELALLHVTEGALTVNIGSETTAAGLDLDRVKLGGLETEQRFSSRRPRQPEYVEVTRMLSRITTGSRATRRVVRG